MNKEKKDGKPKVIKFFLPKDPYGYFANFTRCPVEINGKIWPSTEHFYQAQKFHGTPTEERIRKTKSPLIAASIGKSKKRPLREDWDNVRVDYMRKAIRAKFTQHEDLKQKLLATGDAIIIEHTARDHFWGDGGDGSGENMFGKLLMELREELRKGSR